MIGFKTIGNATLVAYDDVPILVADPWLGGEGGAYFGSWQLAHEIPAQEREEILACSHVWLSHGHPDHLNAESMEQFRGARILVPDHVGDRIRSELQALEYQVSVLPDRKWVDLSPRIRVCSIGDYNQDAVLLVDINGRLVVNVNDAQDRGWGGFVRKLVRDYDRSYLLKPTGYGDADMNNIFDEEGTRHAPAARAKGGDLGRQLAAYADYFGVTHAIPFSSFHQYQRADSVWANELMPHTDEVGRGFNAHRAEYLPPFIEVDCDGDGLREIDPRPLPVSVVSPEEFGDDWGDLLETGEEKRLEDYFRQRTLLANHIGFLNFRVGGKDHPVRLNAALETGISFEVPRNSLMTAIQYSVFDDLLIGNFMKTTLHGLDDLYPNFTPVVAKYADSGKVFNAQQLKTYMAEYRRRAPLDYLLHTLQRQSQTRFRRFVSRDSMMFNIAKRSYIRLMRR